MRWISSHTDSALRRLDNVIHIITGAFWFCLASLNNDIRIDCACFKVFFMFRMCMIYFIIHLISTFRISNLVYVYCIKKKCKRNEHILICYYCHHMVDIRLEVDYTCVHIIRMQYKESNSVEILSDCCKSGGPGDKSLMHFCSFLFHVLNFKYIIC